MKSSQDSLGGDDLEEQLSQNIKLRQQLGSEIARVLSVNLREEGAKVTSDSNSLEALRRELRLRRNSKLMNTR